MHTFVRGTKKGDSILFTSTSAQCFLDEAGVALAGLPTGFCGVGLLEAFLSTSTGVFTILSGTGKFAGATGGGGTIDTAVSHCGADVIPVGNFGTAEIKGTIEY